MERKMESQIFGVIDELEQYISECKPKLLSSTEIYVEKEVIQGYIDDLRRKAPEEIARYQKIISNKEAILEDARKKAEQLIQEATIHTNQLINEHEIMQQAYAQANEVVTMASKQAQEILDNATEEANGVKTAAMQYMDDVLSHLESIITSSTQAARSNYDSLIASLDQYKDVIQPNRSELHPAEEETETIPLDEEANLDLM